MMFFGSMGDDQPPVSPSLGGTLKRIGDTPVTPAGDYSPAPLYPICHCERSEAISNHVMHTNNEIATSLRSSQ